MKKNLRTSAVDLSAHFMLAGVDKVREILANKPNSGPTLLKAIETVEKANHDAAPLRALHEELYGASSERGEYLAAVDRETQCTVATAIAFFPSAWQMNTGTLGILLRLFAVESVGVYREEGKKGKPSSVYKQKDILRLIETISEFRNNQ